ncbi:matrilin-3-like, partial [Physella acuta]|uniref:matrilin-3-like n=1 Tax=Physella acuta TaxID=109671 RepID=UPI0027DD5CAF
MYLQLFAVVCLVAPLMVMSAPAQSNCNKTELDECLAQPMDLSFVIDSSNSINRPNFTEALWFVQNIIDNFNIGPDKVRVSTITYGSDVHPSNRIDFTSYKDKDSLKAAISLIERGEGLSTRTDLGI